MMKVGVIGGGYWGKNIIRTLHEMNALAAVADHHQAHRDFFQDAYPDIQIYENGEALIASDVEAVAIVTPVLSHFELAKAAILAGKDVFVEKPITETAAQAEELKCLAQEHDRILTVGHLLLYLPAVQFIKQFIDSGKLGKLHAFHQVRYKGIVREHVNVLYDLGVHDIAVLTYLIGEEPCEVRAHGHAISQKGIEDELVAHLAYDSGVHAHLYLSWLRPKKERCLTILGEKGSLVYDEINSTVYFFESGSEEPELIFDQSAKPLSLELEDFLACVETRKVPVSHSDDACVVMRTLEKVMKAL